MKKCLVALFLLAALAANAKDFPVTSPDGRLKATVSVGEVIRYAVFLNDIQLIAPSTISIKVGDDILGLQPNTKKYLFGYSKEELSPVVRQKSAVLLNEYNEIELLFKGNYSLVFRAYDDGIAWRWKTSFKDEITVYNEEVTFTFPEDDSIFFPKEESMFTHQERDYLHIPISEIMPNQFSSVPALVDRHDGIKIALTEADLQDYPGFYLTGSMNHPHQLIAIYPAYPKAEEQTNDRNVKVIEREKYMAKTAGTRAFPWRVMIITEKDADLVESQMIYKLSAPQGEGWDFSWVKPGKVAWDWWNANNIYGVDFKSGINTETYKYYIDFASKYGIEYIILDEGWYELGDLTKINPEINMEELLAYGKEKNVGIILWVVWKTLWDQLDVAMDQFQQWGVKGIKVDFMQRDDQWMVDYYWKIAEAAAARHLLVDFHGSYKPAGLHRTWPNVITREGVRGMEWGKWGPEATPELAVTLPFTRMVAGPMDYTPGAMINATKAGFRPVYDRPMSQGTRCQQLAMYVVFESPLQMLADNPSHYLEEPGCMEFLGPVPTTWDETHVLDGEAGDYILVARRSGDTWYLGAMTDWTARDLPVDLSFLGDEAYSAKIWKDGVNADRYADDFAIEQMTLGAEDDLSLHLAPGGGFVAVLKKVSSEGK